MIFYYLVGKPIILMARIFDYCVRAVKDFFKFEEVFCQRCGKFHWGKK